MAFPSLFSFSNPALIPSSLPLLSSASPYFSFLLFSIPVPYSPILTSLLIPCSPWHPLPFPSVLFPHLLLSASHFQFCFDPKAGSPLISSSVFTLYSSITHYVSLLSYSVPSITPVCLWLSLASPRTSSLALIPLYIFHSRPFNSQLPSSDSVSHPKAACL